MRFDINLAIFFHNRITVFRDHRTREKFDPFSRPGSLGLETPAHGVEIRLPVLEDFLGKDM